MTAQQIADAALAVFQANRNNPEVEAMLDRVLAPTVTVEHTQVFVALLEGFWSFPTADEFERQLRCVEEEMSKCVIFTSPSSSLSPEAS